MRLGRRTISHFRFQGRFRSPHGDNERLRDKIADFNDFCRKYSLKHEDVLYIGDDIPDMEVLSMCGIGVSPADGVAEILEIADYVSPYPGGRGCVRDAVEKVLKARGDWTFDVARYKAKF